jgi:hypothetical protein
MIVLRQPQRAAVIEVEVAVPAARHVSAQRELSHRTDAMSTWTRFPDVAAIAPRSVEFAWLLAGARRVRAARRRAGARGAKAASRRAAWATAQARRNRVDNVLPDSRPPAAASPTGTSPITLLRPSGDGEGDADEHGRQSWTARGLQQPGACEGASASADRN